MKLLSIGDAVTYQCISLREYRGTVVAVEGSTVTVKWSRNPLGTSEEYRPNLAALTRDGKIVAGEVEEWEPREATS